MTETATAETTIVIRRTFGAPRDRVWRAWTDPEALKRWYALDDTWRTPVAEVDLRVGGAYRIGIEPPGTEPFFETGVYREIVPHERLVYTCALAGGDRSAGHEETLVTVEFRDAAGATEVLVTQTGFPTVEQRDLHQRGWSRFLDRLERVELYAS